jgi:hypothetical protein
MNRQDAKHAKKYGFRASLAGGALDALVVQGGRVTFSGQAGKQANA